MNPSQKEKENVYLILKTADERRSKSIDCNSISRSHLILVLIEAIRISTSLRFCTKEAPKKMLLELGKVVKTFFPCSYIKIGKMRLNWTLVGELEMFLKWQHSINNFLNEKKSNYALFNIRLIKFYTADDIKSL